MRNINLCAVVMADSISEMLKNISCCKNQTEFIEVRFDYIQNRNQTDLALIQKAVNKNVIFTCRRSDEGGKWNGTEDERLTILNLASKFGFLVDVELKTLEEETYKLSLKSAKRTLISFHDFKKTPPIAELQKIAGRMNRFHPHIKKIATMVNSKEDEKTLIQLILNKKSDENMCVIGMGALGKNTRILTPLFGSCLSYCTINTNESSAPGQMTCGEMKHIYSLLQ